MDGNGATGLSRAAYARSKGWHKSTVTRYAQQGRIVFGADGLVDVAATDALLAQSADPAREGVRERHEAERREKQAARSAAVAADLLAGAASAPPPPDEPAYRADPSDPTFRLLQKSRAESEAHRAALLRMEREKQEGKLVDAEAVRLEAFKQAREARNAILNMPARLAPLLAAETDPVKVMDLLERELRAACSALAGDRAAHA